MSYPKNKFVPSNEPFFIGGHGGGDAVNTYSHEGTSADNPGGGGLEVFGQLAVRGVDYPIGGLGTAPASGESPAPNAPGGGGGGVQCPPSPNPDPMDPEPNPPQEPSSFANAESGNPIRYANGEIRLVIQDLMSFGYGHEWGHTRTYSNQLDANAQGPNGDRWFVKQMPHLEEDGNNNIAVIGVINDTVWFDSNLDAYFFVQDTLEHDTTNDQYLYRNLRGEVFKFFDFSGAHPTVKQGKFKSYTDPYGEETTVGYDGNNRMHTFTQGTASNNSMYHYEYNDSGDNPDRLKYVNLLRHLSAFRRAAYTYYGTGESHGSVGDLKTAAIEQWDGSSWVELQKSYYRYYKSLQKFLCISPVGRHGEQEASEIPEKTFATIYKNTLPSL